MNDRIKKILSISFPIILLGLIIFGFSRVYIKINESIDSVISPLESTNMQMATQISMIINPTPTIIPDPITIIHEVRSLARLETIQYSVEKIITADNGNVVLDQLFGDKLLFVAHGIVIAGIDLGQMTSNDLWIEDNVLHVNLPDAEIFIATIDNDKSYVYDRDLGLFTKGNIELETLARRAAENEIEKSSIEDGILIQARDNAEIFLDNFFKILNYEDVYFE